MTDTSPITATLNGVLDAVKATFRLVHDAKVAAAVIDIQSKLLEHQTAYLELVEKHQLALAEMNAIKQELLQIKQFQTNRARYQLKTIAPGFAAYVLKHSSANGDDPHWLCPKCLDDGVVGMIQKSPDSAFIATFPGEQNTTRLVCNRCKIEFSIPCAVFNAAWNRYA